MNILAIDTATNVSTVAISNEKKLLSEVIMELKVPQSEVLMKHIKEALDIARLKIDDIDALCISIGPGSFTGLRIGLVVLKMISFAKNIPLYTVSTLSALSFHYPIEDFFIAPIIDAQKGNGYVEIYKYNKDNEAMEVVDEVAILPFENILDKCNKLPKKTIILGDLVQKRMAEIDSTIYPNLIIPPMNMMMPRGSNVILAAKEKIKKGETANIMNLEPFYIRKSEAEVQLEKRLQNGK